MAAANGLNKQANGAGPKMAAGGKRPRKQRQAISCTECRQRKLKCDRKIPGCSACIKRKLPPGRCRFGDERDFETPEQREERVRKASAASAKRAKKRAAAAAAKAAAAAAGQGSGPKGKGVAKAGHTTSHPAPISTTDSDSDSGDSEEDDDASDGGEEEDELDGDETREQELHSAESEGEDSGAPLSKRRRTGSSASQSSEFRRTSDVPQNGHPMINGMSISNPQAGGPALHSDIHSLRQAAAAVAAAVSTSGSGASTPGLVIPSAAQHSALAVQARSNAFAAHAQAQAQQMASASQKHGIAALVAAISNGTPSTQAAAAAAAAAIASGQLPASALAAITAAAAAAPGSSASIRGTMATDVSLTTAASYPSPGAGEPTPPMSRTTSTPLPDSKPLGRKGQTSETDDLLDSLSATDTTSAALGLQRLYETVETLGMLKRNSVDAASKSRSEDKSAGKDGSRNGAGLSAAALEALGKHSSPLAGFKPDAMQRSVGATPSRQARNSSLAAIGAEMMRRDSLFEMSNKARAIALLPGKQQTIHLMQMYLDELGVVIPFVRPDFVMKELDLLYDSLDNKGKNSTSSSFGGTPNANKTKEESHQSAANFVNPVVGTGPGAGLPHPRLTFLAYVFFALGSIAELLPSSYLISYNIVRSSDQVSQTLHDWQETAIGCIDAAELAANPSLEGVQATLVAVIALAHRFRHKDLLRLLDSGTRAARRLGLDRLGSADSSVSPGPSPSLQIDASKRTLQHWWIDPEVEMSAANLEIGRAVWSGILMADWNHCGLNGSYNIHPNSYTTRPPIAPAQPEFCKVGVPSPHDAWLGLLETSEIARRALDLTRQHEMMGTSVDYSAVLALDDELANILKRRSWTDKNEDLTFGQPQLAESEEIKRLRRQASLIRSSVYHRTLKLHRAFMARGYRQPDKYGASVLRSLESANALVDEARTMSKRGWLSSRDRIQKYYLFQACLAMITDLWYRPRPLYETKGDAMASAMQENLSFIIDRLKDEGQSTEGSVLHGASANLERLLSATVQRSLQPNRSSAATLGSGDSSAPNSVKDVPADNPTSAPSSDAAISAPVAMPATAPDASSYLGTDTLYAASAALTGQNGMVDLLDAQLLRLAEMAPQNSLMNLGTFDAYGGSSNGSDIASFAAGSASKAEPGDLNSMLNAGPDWDQAWMDLFETLEGDVPEAAGVANGSAS